MCVCVCVCVGVRCTVCVRLPCLRACAAGTVISNMSMKNIRSLCMSAHVSALQHKHAQADSGASEVQLMLLQAVIQEAFRAMYRR